MRYLSFFGMEKWTTGMKVPTCLMPLQERG